MTENVLIPTEEFDITGFFRFPHLACQKKELPYLILKRNNEALLLVVPSGFNNSLVFAGLTIAHIEFLAKNAPNEYKQELLATINADYKLQEIFEITKSMDDDLGENVTQNQKRIKNVIQYIRDNQIAFEF